MFWILSKLFWLVAQPPALIGLIVLLGLILTFGRRSRRLGQALAGAGLALFFLVGFTNAGKLLLQPLEDAYARPAVFPGDAAGIIVLGGGTDNAVSRARGSYELQRGGDRYVETIRLALAHPNIPILVSGGTGVLIGDEETDAASTARLFAAFGLTGERIRYETASQNTYQNAVNSAALLQPQPRQRYILITSAWHMPRAIALFKAAGFDIVPWPVDFRSTGRESLMLFPFFASLNIDTTTVAMREWIGMFAYWAAGRIPSPWP